MSAVLLGSTLAGCAGKAGTSGDVQGDPKPETQAQAQAEAGGNTDSNFNAQGLPIINEKETFTIAVPQRSTLKAASQKACVIAAEDHRFPVLDQYGLAGKGREGNAADSGGV